MNRPVKGPIAHEKSVPGENLPVLHTHTQHHGRRPGARIGGPLGEHATIGKSLHGSSWQRSRERHPQLARPGLPRRIRRWSPAAFRSILTLTTPADVAAPWDKVAVMVADRFPKAAALMDSAKTDVLAFTAFPRAHWRHAI